MRRSQLFLTTALVLASCDVEPDDGLFGGGPPAPATTTAPAATDDGDSGSETGKPALPDADDDTGGAEPPPPPMTSTSGDPMGSTSGDPIGSTGVVDEGGSTGAPVSDEGGGAGVCCTATALPGCIDPAVEACVCAVDGFCCDTEWDALCVTTGADSCGSGCAGGGGGMLGGVCCLPQGVPGCGNAAIEACVCAFDLFCCDTEWDQLCADAVPGCGYTC
jgi:hypothetical protein